MRIGQSVRDVFARCCSRLLLSFVCPHVASGCWLHSAISAFQSSFHFEPSPVFILDRARPRTSHISSLPVARCRRSCSRQKALALPFHFFLLSGVSAGVSAAGKPIAAGQPSRFFLSPFFVLRAYLLFALHVFDDPIAKRKPSLSPFSFPYLQAFLQAFLQPET